MSVNKEEITIRKFEEKDIPNKVKWINDNNNNSYLHYNLPLTIKETTNWYKNIKNMQSRYDAIIEYKNIPVGVIGLINIDKCKGEYYITLGERNYKRKGISYIASKKIINYGFTELGLNKIWLCVDSDNIAARNLYEKLGFKLEGILRKDIYFKGKMIDRCMYGIIKEEWSETNEYINN